MVREAETKRVGPADVEATIHEALPESGYDRRIVVVVPPGAGKSRAVRSWVSKKSRSHWRARSRRHTGRDSVRPQDHVRPHVDVSHTQTPAAPARHRALDSDR
jgi:hypothetical protein